MPRRNTPKIDKIRADPSWDWFLSQKGIYGKGTLSANYLLRRVFTDYQDWSIPEFCLHELDEAKSQEKENDENSIFQSAHLGNTKDDKISDGEDNPNNMEASLSEEIDSDNAKEGKIMDPQKHGESDEEDDKSEESIDESCERNDESNEKGEKNEMGIVNALDLDIRNYQTDDWKVYW
ncbi:hypothetical protein PENVUL_c003G06922 [Penicillium vulpinum]|uniref:Uncharacterized protein n=2 Tax=Penicillium vulpinum TaxID=29845 RepID=A0A1V6SAK3_9EURO|nr:hypothetical protein PENVUL_c003G06922 [Penicillium vulpinum]